MDTQKIVSESKLISYSGYKNRVRMTVKLRFDDECMNGHNSFSITAEIKSGRNIISCGCLHDEIAKHFPEYREAIKWHLWSTDGSMHHVANEEGLMKRLPEQLEQFQKCIESLGLIYTTAPIQPSWKTAR